MISSNTQLFSLFISLIIGFVYYFVMKYIISKFNSCNLFLKIIIDLLYVLLLSLIIIYIYYKVNGGYIHFSYPLFYVCGYYAAFIVNKYVKIHGKTFFSDKK